VVNKFSHIGIAVASLERALATFQGGFGLAASAPEEVPEQKVRLAMLTVGESRLELLESTDPEGPIGRFLAGRGEGVHHVALAVDDIEAALAQARRAGLRLIDERPRPGAHGTRVAFVHPRGTHGVLVELVEERPSCAGGGEHARP
jgi:methylmalonyl-CoA/ethylmalonyl-CoA epimerase